MSALREAAIASAARTPIGRAYKGAYIMTHGVTPAGHAIAHAVERAGIEPEPIEDCILGVGMPEGATGHNVARNAAIRADLPNSVAGSTVNRYCASGLQAIGNAAARVVADGAPAIVAGGVESISLVESHMNLKFYTEEWLMRHREDRYVPVLNTADNMANRYHIPRDVQDAYALQSQQRTAAQAAGKFDDEIVPIGTFKYEEDKAAGTVREVMYRLEKDEGSSPTAPPPSS